MKYILLFSLLIMFEKACSQGFALVELFTSQGCSSCPAADKNLRDVIQEAEKEGKPVYGLSFHVDYWNYIGWKDPYSSKEFTERQQTYSQKVPLSSMYTPQIVVNGHDEFVGSNKKGVETSIDFSLHQQPTYQISISALTVSGDKVNLKYSLNKDPSGEFLNLAVVERDVKNFVPRGENSGKHLQHDNVVRAFKTFPLKRQGELTLTIPSINSVKTSVIIYIQNNQWRVLAAAAMSLPH